MENDVNIHYDEKGKFYTDKRVKEKVSVIIQTTTQKISGYINVPPSSDISTELNSLKDQFITVSNPIFLNKDEQSHNDIETLTLNRNYIIWVINNKEETE